MICFMAYLSYKPVFFLTIQFEFCRHAVRTHKTYRRVLLETEWEKNMSLHHINAFMSQQGPLVQKRCPFGQLMRA